MKTKQTTDGLWQAAVQPIVDWLAQGVGRKASLVAAFQAAEPTARTNVEQWLHADPEKRIHPRLGAGLLLLRLASEAGCPIDFQTLGAARPTTTEKPKRKKQ